MQSLPRLPKDVVQIILQIFFNNLSFKKKIKFRHTDAYFLRTFHIVEFPPQLEIKGEHLALFPNLTTLYASFNPNIKGEHLALVPKLTTLYAVGNPNIKGEHLALTPNLTTLDANWNTKIKDEEIEQINSRKT